MHPMSDEQRKVLDFIRSGKNVIVDACAGSGKSTTILSIAKELTGKKIRQFTYNSQLRFDVKENVKKYTRKSDPIDVMGALRQDKDKFKPKH